MLPCAPQHGCWQPTNAPWCQPKGRCCAERSPFACLAAGDGPIEGPLSVVVTQKWATARAAHELTAEHSAAIIYSCNYLQLGPVRTVGRSRVHQEADMSVFDGLLYAFSHAPARAIVIPVPLPSSPAPPMHIPDGFLSAPLSLLMWLLAAICVGYALMRVNRDLDDRKVPLMGVMAAAIFAAQMLNFAVAAGTSGHLMGAALAAIVLGPWAAIVVMTSVIGTQALLFQDGGLLALGANMVNMALVGVAVGYAVYVTLRRWLVRMKWALFVSAFASAWCSTVVAALFVALQLAASGTSPANFAVPAMGGIHMLIGIGEGLITVGAVALLRVARPDLVMAGQGRLPGSRALVIGGLAAAILLAILSPLASASPDGLEWVAEQQGFLNAAQDAPYEIIPDYVMPGIADERAATILAGVVGIVIVSAVMLLANVARGRRKSARSL